MLREFLRILAPNKLKQLVTRVRWSRRADAAYRQRIARYRSLGGQRWDHDQNYCLSMLQMSAHILDKGLHADNWQRDRSKDAYAKARHYYLPLQNTKDPSYEWAGEVISEFEARTSGEDYIRRPSSTEKTPAPLHPDHLMAHLQYRTSVRQFAEQCVPESCLRQLADAALQAASSCHRQTVRIYGTVNPEITTDVGRCFHGFTCYSAFVPAVLVFCVDLRPYTFPAELFTPTIDTALGVQNAVLYASSLGLSVTLLNWTGAPEREAQLRKLLEIPDHEAIVVGAACGYPGRPAARPLRKSITRILTLK